MRRFLVFFCLVATCSASFAQAPKSPLDHKTTAEFLAYCGAHPDFIKTRTGPCADEILMGSIVIMVKEGASHASTCMPGANDAEQSKLLGDVMAWLGSHRSLASADHSTTIITALKTLYPCRR